MPSQLILKDGTKYDAESFGYEGLASGEVVFASGMVGYPEFQHLNPYNGGFSSGGSRRNPRE